MGCGPSKPIISQSTTKIKQPPAFHCHLTGPMLKRALELDEERKMDGSLRNRNSMETAKVLRKEYPDKFSKDWAASVRAVEDELHYLKLGRKQKAWKSDIQEALARYYCQGRTVDEITKLLWREWGMTANQEESYTMIQSMKMKGKIIYDDESGHFQINPRS